MTTPAGSETFRKVIEHAPFGICLVDAQLTVVEFSAGAHEILGVTGSVIGLKLGDVLQTAWTDAVADDLVERFRETLATGIPYHATATAAKHDDGKALQVFEWSLEQTQLPDGQPSVIGYFDDLSERADRERKDLRGRFPGMARGWGAAPFCRARAHRRAERKGFGSTVLDRIDSGSLSGKVEIAYPPEGLRRRVTCPDSCLLS